MRNRLASLMALHGQPVVIAGSGHTSAVSAFLQPLRRRGEVIPYHVTPLGAVCRRRWLYIGPWDVPLAPGDRVTMGDLRLSVQESQTIYQREAALYQRAILEERREAGPCAKA